MMRKVALFFLSLFCTTPLLSQVFEDITPTEGFPLSFDPNTLFADMDGDGDLDIVLFGYDHSAIIYNDDLTFTRQQLLPEYGVAAQFFFKNVDLGDFNRDGLPDILFVDYRYEDKYHILINNNPGFSKLPVSWSVQSFNGSFGDYDNDGDLDLLLDGNIGISEAGSLDFRYWLQSPETRFSAWLDTDGDSRLEIIQSSSGSYSFNGIFLHEHAGIVNSETGTNLNIDEEVFGVANADYDNDGDQDYLLQHFEYVRLYVNEGGSLTYSGKQFPKSKTVIWADMNNDGKQDIVLGGAETAYYVFETVIYQQADGGTFVKATGTGLSSEEKSSIAVGDIDKDGDLDLMMVGQTVLGDPVAKLFRNKQAETTVNTSPSVPANLQQTVNHTTATLSWDYASDAESQVNSLTYNLSVSKASGELVIPPHSTDSGERMLVKAGNAHHNNFFELRCLQEGSYTWKVQSIDAGLRGSAFSAEGSFTIANTAPTAPANLAATTISDKVVALTWTDGPNETGYIIYRRTIGDPYSDFSYPHSSVEQDVTSFNDTELEPNTAYEYKVVASSCAYPSGYESTALATTFKQVLVPNASWLELGDHSGRFLALADIDNDKDLDLLFSYTGGLQDQTSLFKFSGSGFTDSGIRFPYLAINGGAKWIDINNDDFLDLFFVTNEQTTTQLSFYINQEGSGFEARELSIDLPFEWVWPHNVSFADYDNDGDEDLLFHVYGSYNVSFLYIFNNEGDLRFTNSQVEGLEGYTTTDEPWADYDGDGDLDILVNTQTDCSNMSLAILENNEGQSFTLKPLNLRGQGRDVGSLATSARWGDFNGDGYADVFLAGLSGCSSGDGISALYLNNGNKTFSPSTAEFQALSQHVYLHPGDYNNDGRLDIFQYGDPSGYSYRDISRIYTNEGEGVFAESIDYLITSTQAGSAAIGDIDNDHDLDLVIAGEVDYIQHATIVYENMASNSWQRENAAPGAPSNLRTVFDGEFVEFLWDAPNDAETVSASLTYQLYLVSENGTIINSNSHPDGTRKLAAQGNAGHATSYRLKNLKPGSYQWSVQAIDAGYKGSAFAEEENFLMTLTGLTTNSEDVLLFPNPLSDELYIQLPGTYAGQVQLKITDVAGQNRYFNLQKVAGKLATSVHLQALPKGVYIVEIMAGDRLFHQKIVKE